MEQLSRLQGHWGAQLAVRAFFFCKCEMFPFCSKVPADEVGPTSSLNMNLNHSYCYCLTAFKGDRCHVPYALITDVDLRLARVGQYIM